ncbi:hypothetical protein NC653_003691 [Populus alba x Populus x berolinensis]|uniref:Uncharacterized protein n=1 Tax=Populus alba x Populus x berolinensis TaxID=444605 RepID=A0AAD6WJ31_9ROSI|nr:hypothetical protein NC653_003691 [Populus alba x Populus x berolinensis]
MTIYTVWVIKYNYKHETISSSLSPCFPKSDSLPSLPGVSISLFFSLNSGLSYIDRPGGHPQKPSSQQLRANK